MQDKDSYRVINKAYLRKIASYESLKESIQKTLRKISSALGHMKEWAISSKQTLYRTIIHHKTMIVEMWSKLENNPIASKHSS